MMARFSLAARSVMVPALGLGLVLALATPVDAGKSKKKRHEDLVSVLLSPGLAQWLVGPISRIASEEEIREYLTLRDDAAAKEFIEEFWQKRTDPSNPWPGRQVRDVFEERLEEADRLFTEGTNLGRRTDRGELFVIYGTPQKRTYLQSEERRKTTYEVWLYDARTTRGLDGSAPKGIYYFTRKNGVTVVSAPPRNARVVLSRTP